MNDQTYITFFYFMSIFLTFNNNNNNGFMPRKEICVYLFISY